MGGRPAPGRDALAEQAQGSAGLFPRRQQFGEVLPPALRPGGPAKRGAWPGSTRNPSLSAVAAVAAVAALWDHARPVANSAAAESRARRASDMAAMRRGRCADMDFLLLAQGI